MANPVLYAHIGSLCVAGTGVMVADSSAMNWLRGKRETVSRAAIFIAHWIVTIGLAGLIVSGLFLFWPLREYLVGQPLFWLKMGFVGALVINSFFIEQLMHVAAYRPFAELSVRERVPLFVSGAVSGISWVGAFFIALMLF